jgi:WhiB family transcriptional regulator, redox-sensing transcriptional regulator
MTIRKMARKRGLKGYLWAIGFSRAIAYLQADPGRRPRTEASVDQLQDQDWRAQADCAKTNPDLWFAPGAMEHKEAKRICRHCPVQRQCLSYAMSAPVDHGVWGGLTERERRRQRRLGLAS